MIHLNCEILLSLLSTIFTGITAISVFIGIITLIWTRKQNHFNAVQICNQMFRDLVRRQQNRLSAQTHQLEIDFRDHLGIVGEEIFYIKNRMLPASVAFSWLSEIPRRIPVYDHLGKLINSSLLRQGENRELFVNYQGQFDGVIDNFGHIKHRFKLTLKEEKEILKKIEGRKLTPPPGQSLLNSDNWEQIRPYFARLMYRKIRGTRRQRFCEFFKLPWYNWRKRECRNA
jgi:hypothetical protein